jgi:hypothetical protein
VIYDVFDSIQLHLYIASKKSVESTSTTTTTEKASSAPHAEEDTTTTTTTTTTETIDYATLTEAEVDALTDEVNILS